MMGYSPRAHECIDPAPWACQECSCAIYVKKAVTGIAARQAQALSNSLRELIDELIVERDSAARVQQLAPASFVLIHSLDDARPAGCPASFFLLLVFLFVRLFLATWPFPSSSLCVSVFDPSDLGSQIHIHQEIFDLLLGISFNLLISTYLSSAPADPTPVPHLCGGAGSDRRERTTSAHLPPKPPAPGWGAGWGFGSARERPSSESLAPTRPGPRRTARTVPSRYERASRSRRIRSTIDLSPEYDGRHSLLHAGSGSATAASLTQASSS